MLSWDDYEEAPSNDQAVIAQAATEKVAAEESAAVQSSVQSAVEIAAPQYTAPPVHKYQPVVQEAAPAPVVERYTRTCCSGASSRSTSCRSSGRKFRTRYR